MDVCKIASYLILTGFLSAAAVQDVYRLKVSNRLILLGICAAVPLRIMWGGVGNLVWLLPNIILPVIFLYLFYLAGALGASDIKLFSLVGCFFSLKELLFCIVIAFGLGAVFSLLKMLYNGNFRSRMFWGFMYICDVMRGDIRKYEMVDDENVVHFSVSILLGAIVAGVIV